MQDALSIVPLFQKCKSRVFSHLPLRFSYPVSKGGDRVAYTKKGYCVGAMGSMTMALKATRALAAHGIFAEVISLAANETKRGCAFGVEFACADEARVRTALRASRMAVSQYFKKG